MVRRWRGLREAGAALTALLLAVLAFGPGMDSLICRDEAVAAFAQSATLDLPSPGADDHAHDTGDVCVHGHCHHGGGSMPALAAVTQMPGPWGAARQTRSRARVPTTNPKFGLMRPPRA